jgi:hypothetical protein
MGGFGSGGWNATGRPTVEEVPRLDVMQLRKAGALEDGWRGGWQWIWTSGRRSNIAVTVEGELVHLDFTVRIGQRAPEKIHQSVQVTWSPCRFGGARPYWLCPGCGRRCAVLHGLRHFACRRCNNLSYASQRERAVDRSQRRADRLRRTLGGEPGLGRIPPRPKGMHHSTYERHLEQIFAADEATGAHLEAMLARLQRRR